LKVIEFLEAQNLINGLYYPTLSTHPNSEIHRKQASGGGGVICFRTKNSDVSHEIVRKLELFRYSVSFGSIHSTVNIPAKTSHLARNNCGREDISDLVRLSIGIEDCNDLITDLSEAFKKI
jgi:cystathionine beta-lyase/cystathionine gamma-synthase